MPKYIPEPTPTIEVIDEQGVEYKAIRDLQRYIDVELRRISESINVKVDGAYGGIFQTTAQVIISPLDINPVLFDPFDTTTPEILDGVEGFPAQGSLVILTPGAFQVSFSTSVVNIPPNAEYGFLLALNGVSTGLGGEIAPSNQTDNVLLGINILFNTTKGDVLTMLINSSTDTDAVIEGAEFSVNRVSEEF